MEKLEMKIGESRVIEDEEGRKVRLKCVQNQSCGECFFYSKPCCNAICSCFDRADHKSVIYVEDKSDISADIETLERIAKEYSGRTIENIINNLKQRQTEILKHNY